MPRQDDGVVQSEGGDRVLNLGAVRLHNNHIQSGQSTDHGCAVCGEGLEGAMASAGPRDTRDEVAEGDGADEEEDPALSFGDGAYQG